MLWSLRLDLLCCGGGDGGGAGTSLERGCSGGRGSTCGAGGDVTVEAAEDVVVAVVVAVVAAAEAAVGFVVAAAAAVPWVSSSPLVLLPTTAVSPSVQQCLKCWMRSPCWRCRHQSHRRSRSAKGLCHGPGIGKKTCQLSRKILISKKPLVLLTFMCFLRLDGCVYDLSHPLTLQLYGLSDVWTWLCFFRSLELAKRRSQPSNSHLKGFSPARQRYTTQ